MKRILFTLILGLVMLFSTIPISSKEFTDLKDNNVELYEMNFNIHNLSKTLKLTEDQYNDFYKVNQHLAEMTKSIALEKNDQNKKKMFKNAIDIHLREVKNILNDKQYRYYLFLLNTTLNNRGLTY